MVQTTVFFKVYSKFGKFEKLGAFCKRILKKYNGLNHHFNCFLHIFRFLYQKKKNWRSWFLWTPWRGRWRTYTCVHCKVQKLWTMMAWEISAKNVCEKFTFWWMGLKNLWKTTEFWTSALLFFVGSNYAPVESVKFQNFWQNILKFFHETLWQHVEFTKI